jgi:3-hydroxyisobutyrate dehydrogenase-like beta-hydroxyacid dehydrogenase
MVKRDFQPGFMVDLLQKDLRLVMEGSDLNKIPLPATALIHQLLDSLEATGDGKCGTQALVKVVERLAAIEVGQKK